LGNGWPDITRKHASDESGVSAGMIRITVISSSVPTAPKSKRPNKKTRMTIAIGAYCIGGLLVCADTNVVAYPDNTVTSGHKVAAVECGDRSYVIANASNDGNAGNMIAKEILDELSKSSTDRWNIEPTIKAAMQRWHSGYTQGNPPQVTFVLAANTGLQHRRLYYCEAPNTVLPKHLGEPVVIGGGAQVVEPLVPSVVTGAIPMRGALLQVAYLMYRAKRDHIYLRGSETDALVISSSGEVHWLPQEEMATAEALCAFTSSGESPGLRFSRMTLAKSGCPINGSGTERRLMF
jgi:hypothetical protein